MGAHPLIDRASQREVRQAKGFKDAAAALTGELLAGEIQQEIQAAPRRGDAGKKFLTAYNKRLAGERKAARDGEHAALGLVRRRVDGGAPLEIPDRDTFSALHACVAVKSAPADKARGADDPNYGIDKIDLIGIGPEDRLTVVMMKYIAGDGNRVGTGDTPLRALLEGLAYVAIVEANRDALVAELSGLTDRTISSAPPALMLMGSARYWELCRKREAQRGAAWINEMERLGNEIEEAANVPVLYQALDLKAELGWTYEDGAPKLENEPRIRRAWEPLAGRIKPKTKPRSRKKTAPEDTIVEADMARPVRDYGASEIYSAGDRIQHPTLGLGVVQGLAGPTKIRVLFDGDRKSLLVHAR